MLSGSRHDLSTYQGRAAHYFTTTNPLNVLASSERLQRAKEVVEEIQRTDQLPAGMTLDEAWDQKELYDSAYHPDTGELVFLPGRMSFQVPGNVELRDDDLPVRLRRVHKVRRHVGQPRVLVGRVGQRQRRQEALVPGAAVGLGQPRVQARRGRLAGLGRLRGLRAAGEVLGREEGVVVGLAAVAVVRAGGPGGPRRQLEL